MKALTINETLRNISKDELTTITKDNSSIKQYFNDMFIFLVREFPPQDAAEFLSEYEDQVIEYYKQGLSVFKAAIILRQSYEKYLNRFDNIAYDQKPSTVF